MEDKTDKTSRSVRALEIVEAVANADRPMTVVDLVDLTGLPKATLHRLCNLLEEEGFLRPDLSGRGVVVGHRLARLARLTLATSAERSYRHGILHAVSHEIGETCNIVIPRGTEMFYSDRVETKWPLRHQLPIGSNVPVHCTASGKLYLASLTKRQCDNLVSVLSMERFTENTITTPEELLKTLSRVRKERVGIDNEEFVEGMVAVGVPINDDKGRLVAVLAFHAPTVRMDVNKARTYLPVLQKAALALSANIDG
jgi:IclR family transcriptional regulator, acetate operon repressor